MKKVFILTLFVFIVSLFSFALIPEITHADTAAPTWNGIVPCGTHANGTYDTPCTLCHFVIGFKNLIDFGSKILVTVALAGIFIAGLMYIISSGDETMMTQAKGFLKASITGFAIVLGAWLIVNTTLWALGTKGDLGIGVESWNKFTCSTISSAVVKNSNSNSAPVTKELQQLEVQCEAGATNSIALDTNSITDKPDNYQLKAIGKFKYNNADGTSQIKTEDVTADANIKWGSVDETVTKVDKGKVTAIKSGSTTVKATYSDKTTKKEVPANNVTAFVNICPSPAASEPPPSSTMGCSVCHGKDTTPSKCTLLAGSKNASFVFMLVRAQHTSSLLGLLNCKGFTTWDDSNQNQLNGFKTTADQMAKGLDQVKSADRNYFAVYRMDEIYNGINGGQLDQTIAKDCPEAAKNKFFSYGYIYTGEGGAYTISGNDAYYCSIEDMDKVFAHEQIGHGFAKFRDEYLTGKLTSDKWLPGMLSWTNITSDNKCAKWQDITKGCVQGCDYSSTSCYRSADNSIMRYHWESTGIFTPVQDFIIYSCANDFSNCPPKNLKE